MYVREYSGDLIQKRLCRGERKPWSDQVRTSLIALYHRGRGLVHYFPRWLCLLDWHTMAGRIFRVHGMAAHPPLLARPTTCRIGPAPAEQQQPAECDRVRVDHSGETRLGCSRDRSGWTGAPR